VCRSVRDKYANLAESIIRADSFLFPRSFLRIDQFIYIATSRPDGIVGDVNKPACGAIEEL
jgi:hypothetical protein